MGYKYRLERERFEERWAYLVASGRGEAALTSERLEEADTELLFAVLGFEAAYKHLEEACGIGVWQKSDDCSDNRRKRQELREAAWSAESACDGLTRRCPTLADEDEVVGALMAEAAALGRSIGPLADVVTDTMGDNLVLDSDMKDVRDWAESLAERARRLRDAYSARLARRWEAESAQGDATK